MTTPFVPPVYPLLNPDKIQILEAHNPVQRDARLTYVDSSHTYTIDNADKLRYTSVTTFCHSHFEKFDAGKIIANMMKGKNLPLFRAIASHPSASHAKPKLIPKRNAMLPE